MSRILVVDGEPSLRALLRDALERRGHEVKEASTREGARRHLSQNRFDLALLDIGAGGLELLDELASRGAEAPAAALMTAQNTVCNAVEAMKRGAFDYLPKPLDLERVEELIEKALRVQSLRHEVTVRPRRVGTASPYGAALVGMSPAMVETFRRIGRAANSRAPVLILGERGTGKGLVARTIHYHSCRRDGPFIRLQPAAIPAESIEEELFGKVRASGAARRRAGRLHEGEGGTLLLEEVTELPLTVQAKLLRVLEEREGIPLRGRRSVPIDVRIIATTQRDPGAAIAEGRLREDLYLRLSIMPICLAPLRHRPQDIPILVEHFVEHFSHELGVLRRWPTRSMMEQLLAHRWPGNVRELENVIQRALVLAPGDVLTDEDVEEALQGTSAADNDWAHLVQREFVEMLERSPLAPEEGLYRMLLHRLNRAVFQEALSRSNGCQIQAARLVGIHRNTLRRKLGELGIGAAPAA